MSDAFRTYMSLSRVSPALSLLCLSTACYSVTLLQDPEPLAPFRTRMAIGTSLAPAPTQSDLGVRFTPEIGLRVGLPHDLEARAKVYVQGVEAGLNARVVDSDRFDLMVMPGFSGARGVLEDRDIWLDEEFYPEHEIAAFNLPIIANVAVVKQGVDVFLGPDVRAGRRDGEGFFALGGHAGLGLHVNEAFSFVPECGLVHVLAGADAIPGSPETYPNTFMARGDTQVRCSLGMTFGGPHAGDR